MSDASLTAGHRNRLRQRFLTGGTAVLADYEVLELLLTYAIPRRDVKPVAKQLLARFDRSLGKVLDASVEELCEVDGIGENAAALLKLARAILPCYLEERLGEIDVLGASDKVIDYVRCKIGGLPDETVLTMYLDAHNHVIRTQIDGGTVDMAHIYLRKIGEDMLRFRASGVILFHNHPSGVAKPSPADLNFTRELAAFLAQFNARLVDHVIVGRSGHFSCADNNLL